VPDDELAHPTVKTVGKLVWNTVAYLFQSRIGLILGSSFLVLMLWGYHGEVTLLRLWKAWAGPGSDPATRVRLIPGIPWDHEWISYAIGLVLVVGIPCALIRLVYHQRLSDYGLGWARPGRGKLAVISAALLLVVSAPAFLSAKLSPDMAATYPLYRGTFEGPMAFVLYQLGYFVFFVAIEFAFRGYLLLGLYQAQDRDVPPGPPATGVPGRLLFGHFAILISMLSYTAWHLGKPLPELWGTLVWGLAAGAIVLATGTIWPVVVVHWLLNVLLDFLMLST
jgi:hypothetical protein